MYFCNFVIISPWKRLGPWFEQIWIPYTQGWFMLSLVEIGLVVLEKKIFLKFVNVFLQLRDNLPLEKGRVLHLNKFEFPLPKNAFCQVWLKLAHWFWRRSWNVTTTMKTTATTTTDNIQIFIRKAHLSLRLRWAKNGIRDLLHINSSIVRNPR